MDRPTGIESLSQRQKEILRLVAQQLEAKEIARVLSISERTVRTHMEEARKRLGVARSRDAARVLIAHEQPAPLGNDDRPQPLPIAKPVAEDLSLRQGEPSYEKRPDHDDAGERSGRGDAPVGEKQHGPPHLNRLSAWQVLGLILLVSVVMPMIVAVVLEAAVFAIRSVHDLKEQFH